MFVAVSSEAEGKARVGKGLAALYVDKQGKTAYFPCL
jgi:hypothetical protein